MFFRRHHRRWLTRILILSSIGILVVYLYLTNYRKGTEEDNIKVKGSKQVEAYYIPEDSLPARPDAPGDWGKPIALLGQEKIDGQDSWSLNEFNLVVSDKIPYDRKLKDGRNDECRAIDYPLDELPRASLIIIFHNEALSTLLRTTTSCYNRAPKALLQEILLVDDKSDRNDLMQPLDDYVNQNFDGKVKIIRAPSRRGLIRAKNYGSLYASGEALIFIDSHCECTKGWLEPMLYAMHLNPTTVVQPTIASIRSQSFAFDHSPGQIYSHGSFLWSLLFVWRPIPENIMKDIKSPADNVRSPTLAGGLFGILKSRWEYLGRYDEGMELWGGENLELSFKNWMCNGIIEYIPCSVIGHVFRGKHPYKWYKEGPDKAFVANARRLAETWLDPKFREIFYKALPEAKTVPMGDISDRIKLRESLQCHDFQWFLTNVMVTMEIPDMEFIAEGTLSLTNKKQCLDMFSQEFGQPHFYGCHGLSNQYMYFTTTGQLRFGLAKCLEGGSAHSSAHSRLVVMANCAKSKTSQKWTYNKLLGQLTNDVTGLCLTADEKTNGPVLETCLSESATQSWIFGAQLVP